MTKLFALRRDERGAATIEMAIAVPVLTLFLWGILQIGVIFQANAGMQLALGEGARYATLCLNPSTSGCGVPTNANIVTKMQDKKFGTGIGSFGTPVVTTPATTECTKCRDLKVTYTVTPNFLYFNGPPISLTRTKRVYVAG